MRGAQVRPLGVKSRLLSVRALGPAGANSRPSCQTGSLKYLHHFGLNRFATVGEQLIRHEFVTHSISELPLLPLGSVLGAAAFAAGDKFEGTTCFGSQKPP
jgi:hypothetical protein